MNNPRILSSDPEAGIMEFFHWGNDGTFTLENTQDVTAIVERNKALYAATDARARFGGGGIGGKIAEIPLIVMEDLMKRGIIDARGNGGERFRKWLNDRDNLSFRARPAKL